MKNTPSSKKVVFSPVGNRIAAIFIDSLILLIPAYLITVILLDTWSDFQGIKNFVVMSLFVIYNPIMDSYGGTFGKKFVKSFAINLETQSPPKYLVSLARLILSIAPILIMGYGSAVENNLITLMGLTLLALAIVPILFSKKKQTLYDILTNIVIIEFESTDNENLTGSEDRNGYIDRLENRSSVFPTES